MATIHLMHGFIGFGKTTVAKKLAEDLPAVRLNTDEIMVKLYGRNVPAELHSEYYSRIDTLLWNLAEQIIKSGANVIMDNGAWKKDKRAQDYTRAKAITQDVIFHVVQCDLKIAKARTLARTQNQNEMFIDENAFDELLLQFEPIHESEGYKIIYHDNN